VMMRRVRGAATFSAPSAADIVSVRLGPRMPSHCPLQSRMNGIFKPAMDFQILEGSRIGYVSYNDNMCTSEIYCL